MVGFIFEIVSELIYLYIWAVIIAAVLSTLIAFGVVDTRNRFVYMVADFLDRLTEPALRPIRRFLPNLGAIDISPVVLIVILWAVHDKLLPWLYFNIVTL